MIFHDPEVKEKLLDRLRRVEGQVRGVQNMLNTGRDCREILQQLTAIRAAVHGASLTLLEEYASDCLLRQEDDPQTRQRLLQDLIYLLGKAT